MSIIGIIPARYASTRLKAKPLLEINGKPLVINVWENMKKSTYISRLIIATDDVRILEACKKYGAEVILTSPNLSSGTDRIFEAYKKTGEIEDIIVNIQGDEPLLMAESIDKMLNIFQYNNFAEVGTLITKIKSYKDLISSNTVKVVIDNNNNAMYFSRSPIPFFRDENIENWIIKFDYWKHIGVYAYRKEALYKFINLFQSKYEHIEKLEQLRLLEADTKLLCVKIEQDCIGVDTQEDLDLVRNILAK